MGNKQSNDQNQNQQQKVDFSTSTKIHKKTNKIQRKSMEDLDVLKPNLNCQTWDDDEPIEQNQQQDMNDQQIAQEEQKENVKISQPKKKIDFDLEKNLIFSLKSMTNAVKLDENNSQTIPAMISLETAKNTQQIDLNERPSLDLVCVIDRSGSMSGEKIKQVKEALHCLIELLNEKDRIMLIQFDHLAQRILPFTRVSTQNLAKIKSTIDTLKASGGTKIQLGMSYALKGIKERKYQNPVTSVFLLSDGQDSYDSVEFLKKQALIDKDNNKANFTINSFGFGKDHDPQLMNQICQVQDGNFYYVEQIDTVDEMFIDALGGLFSVIAQNVEITLSLKKDHQIFSDVQISKTYGDMWKLSQDQSHYKINILQLISGVSKEFLLEITLPPTAQKLQDFERNAQLLTAQVKMFANSDEQKQNPITKNANLEMTFYNQQEQIPPEIAEKINDEVELNYLRVRGADVIQKCMEKAEKGEYEEGKKLIQNIQVDIGRAGEGNRKKLQVLFNDLQESESTCNKERFQAEGRFKMISQNKAHMEKRSRNVKSKKMVSSTFDEQEEDQEDIYQNCLQQQMVQDRVMTKKSRK